MAIVRSSSPSRKALALAAAALLAAACSDSTSSSATTAAAPATVERPTTDVVTSAASTTEVPLAAATFTVQPGTEQVAILGAEPGEPLSLNLAGSDVADGTVDAQGSLLFRGIAPGTGYSVRSITTSSAEFDITSRDDVPPAELYSRQQTLFPTGGGFGYITTRDGTTLSANVILPGPADGGPYATVVEYSGYSPSNPDDAALAAMYTSLGFAYVGVNMRGTGCSGGSYRFFEEAQSLDGYDAIEAVAAQPWVLDHRVGMVGISYPGISQLFVAATRPPSLAAITPLSVIDDSVRATLYPGGILNTGFAVEWTQARLDQARPYGQAWTKTRADAGDRTCADNQLLRLQNPDTVAEIEDSPFYDPVRSDPLAPITFVDRIDVPVFLAGAWQDEQTGGHFPAMLDRFTSSPHLYVDLVNGLHTESISPPILARVAEFLQLYVAHRAPDLSALATVDAALGSAIWGVGDFPPPTNRFAGLTYEQALAEFESEPPIRIMFEQGGNAAYTPGTPEPNFLTSLPSWPPPEAVATAWYLDDGGALRTSPPSAGTPDSYLAKPGDLPATFYQGDGNAVWRAGVTYDWEPIPPGDGVGYQTAPLDADTVVVGPGSADLWVQADAPDTDLEVTVSEVRPDGKEIYVQSGWLRASQRRLAADATELRPAHTNLQADSADLPAGEFTPVRVELFPFAHPFRAGSRIRVTVDAPGNARAVWTLKTISAGERVTVAHDAEHPSRIVLSVLPGVTAAAPAPPACGALRGQPCRDFAATSTGG